ncbi:MAG TPA: D-glycero-beta-D-manno-heptose 1-phosphate adenylyltransferase [Burkholderiales bacterium]
MQLDLARLADAFNGLRAAVVGDPLLDVYLDGRVERLCREAPVPLVQVQRVHDAAGGAANVACNLAALGARTTLIGFVGDDVEAARLRRTLDHARVDARMLVPVPGWRTVCKQRLVGDAQIIARFDQGRRVPADPALEALLCERVRAALAASDVLVVSDYGYGSVNAGMIAALADRPRRPRPVVVADGRALARLAPARPSAVKPSYEEARRLLGVRGADDPAGRAEWVHAHADALLAATGADIVAVTLDRDGAVVLQRGRAPYRTYARPARTSLATGSGDTFVAGLALALAAGAETPEAAELASAAAAVVVGKDGTAVCTAPELHRLIAGGDKRLDDLDALAERVQAARAGGARIVFTNGCFDILHRGHVTLLNRAKALGDLLIVGVNTDDSVRRLKGPGRPINTLEDRIKVLAALSYVDYVIAFDDDSPRDIIACVRPDLYVKGGDYSRDTLPEAELVEGLGGAVCILPLVEDRSTTHLIDRIRGVA